MLLHEDKKKQKATIFLSPQSGMWVKNNNKCVLFYLLHSYHMPFETLLLNSGFNRDWTSESTGELTLPHLHLLSQILQGLGLGLCIFLIYR